MFKVIVGNTPYTYKIFYQYDIQEVDTKDTTGKIVTHINKKLVGTRVILDDGNEELPQMEAVAICHSNDTPCKMFGRTLATARLADAYLHEKEEKELWQQLRAREIKFDERIVKSRCIA